MTWLFIECEESEHGVTESLFACYPALVVYG